MLAAKLILTIDDLIEEAKKFAKSQGRSLSNLIEEYLKSISAKDQKSDELELSPITKSSIGFCSIEGLRLDYKQLL